MCTQVRFMGLLCVLVPLRHPVIPGVTHCCSAAGRLWGTLLSSLCVLVFTGSDFVSPFLFLKAILNLNGFQISAWKMFAHGNYYKESVSNPKTSSKISLKVYADIIVCFGSLSKKQGSLSADRVCLSHSTRWTLELPPNFHPTLLVCSRLGWIAFG